jgi:hypothetical protein
MSEQHVVPMPTKEQIHPVYQLGDFLRMASRKNDIQADHQEGRDSVEAQQDKIIRVADFLFGNTLLAAALTLLDSHESTFTKISSMHRSIWLVRGSGDAAYMCYACGDATSSSTGSDGAPNLYFCNCRSFLEKTTKKTTSDQELPELCKHLLALKLIPPLGITCAQLTVSDSDLAKLVLERTLNGAY